MPSLQTSVEEFGKEGAGLGICNVAVTTCHGNIAQAFGQGDVRWRMRMPKAYSAIHAIVCSRLFTQWNYVEFHDMRRGLLKQGFQSRIACVAQTLQSCKAKISNNANRRV